MAAPLRWEYRLRTFRGDLLPSRVLRPGATMSDEITEGEVEEGAEATKPSDDSITRRDFSTATAASVGAVVAGAGGIGVGFLWPLPPEEPVSVYTCLVREVPVGEVKEVRSPRGERIYLIRTEDSLDPEHIHAIGSTCSHLGCKVFYRPDNEESRRFHCPCHQGFFDQSGEPTAGPPERALDRYEVEVRGELLFLKYSRV